MEQKKILITSDHAGFLMKTHITGYLKKKGIKVINLGTNSEESVDYPDFAHKLADKKKSDDIGIAICGSGNGIAMTLNRHDYVRAALCWNTEIARLARQHNDANVCVLPGRFLTLNEAEKIVDTFLNEPFEGGRHTLRVEKIDFLDVPF